VGDADALDALTRSWTRLWAETMRAQSDGFRALGEDSAEADALWRMAEAQADAARAMAATAARGAASAPGGAVLARFLDPAQWLFGGVGAPDPALRRLIAQPARQGFGREGLDASPEARALRRALNGHRAMVAAAFAEMADRYARAVDAAPPRTVEDAQTLWVEAAEALDALHASDAFLSSQAQVVAAALALRAAEAQATADWCAENGLASRAEVDALHRELAELRRELRALKRSLERP
jgi:hypothetical protein